MYEIAGLYCGEFFPTIRVKGETTKIFLEFLSPCDFSARRMFYLHEPNHRCFCIHIGCFMYVCTFTYPLRPCIFDTSNS